MAAHHESMRSICRLARLLTRSFTTSSQLRDELEAVAIVATGDVRRALVESPKQLGSLSVVQVVAERHELEIRAVRKIGRCVHHDPTVANDCLDGVHQLQTLLLSADEARDYGIVDEVIRRRPVLTSAFEPGDDAGSPNGG